MYKLLQLLRAAALCLALSCSASIAASNNDANFGLELQHIKGNLYRFYRQDDSADKQSGVLLVGTTGAAVGDPLDVDTANRLSQLIAEKFSVPVTFVFYTHASIERGAGADVFINQGATLVAHVNAVHNRSVQTGELIAPTLVFDQTLTLNLGEQWDQGREHALVLRYLGRSASDDMIVAHFPQYEAVFASTFVSVESLPLHPLDQGFFPDWFSAIDKLNQIDYSYFLPGQGKIGIRNDAIEHGRYLRELHNRVLRRLRQGQKTDQIIAEIDLRRFSQWQHFKDRVEANVRDMIKVAGNSALR